MNATIERLLQEAPVLLDGAWGTQMQARGLPVGSSPEAWNLSDPDQVEAVAASYVEAGSRIILTNTFGGSPKMLARHDLAEKTTEVNRAGAEISVRAANGKALVFGSIGPCGELLMMGDVTEEELFEGFHEQALALAEGGVDGIVVETMAEIKELQCAVRAAKETGLPVVACMVFDSGAEFDRTMMGVTPEQAAEAIAEAGADVVGSNCGQEIEGFLSLGKRLAAATDLPLWLKPNAGPPELVDGKACYKTSAQSFAASITKLVDAGAAFVGGCCGTDPDFIRATKLQLDQKREHSTC